MLTAAVIFSFIPVFVFGILGQIAPVFRTNEPIRLSHFGTQLNSLFNPLFSCYRDHRFKNALREMLGIKKPQPMSSSVRDTENRMGQDTFRSSELHIVEKRTIRSVTRSASCNLTHTSTV